MILAGDVGGTKTLLGLFERAQPRPLQRHLFRYATTDFSSFSDQLTAFARDVGGMPPLDAIALGVAGPVVGRVARRGTGLHALEEAEQRLGTAHIAGQNHLGWIIVKPA